MSVTQKKCICYWKNILMESLVLRVNLFCMYVYMLQFAHFLLLHFFLCSEAIGMNVMSCACSYACPLYAFALIAERAHTHTHMYVEKNIRQNEKMPLFTFTSQKSIIKLIVRRAYDLFSLLSIFLVCCALCWKVHWPRKWDLQSWFVFLCCRFPSCIHPHETTDNTIIFTFLYKEEEKNNDMK